MPVPTLRRLITSDHCQESVGGFKRIKVDPVRFHTTGNPVVVVVVLMLLNRILKKNQCHLHHSPMLLSRCRRRNRLHGYASRAVFG